MRRAKIVATIGPAISSYENLSQAIRSGMNVARLNMSHGDHSVHDTSYENLRRASADAGQTVAILADLQGPKIRLGRFADGPHELLPGDEFSITVDDVEGTASLCSTTHKGLPGDVNVGDPLLIDDGRVALRATAVSDTTVTTEVVVGGPVSNNKGI
ncbi:pyruvate kinase, partial [Kocuria arenosa]|uniref:pyruvate kinase n=1 Tax=Kocuria arenosa TaxID=3071446 RepID=UPI0034D4956A